MACAKFIQGKITIHDLQKEIIELKKILCTMEKQSRLSNQHEDPIIKKENEAFNKLYLSTIQEYLTAIRKIENTYKDRRSFHIEEGLLMALEADRKLAEIRHGVEERRKKQEEMQGFIKSQDQQKNIKGMVASLRKNFYNQPHIGAPSGGGPLSPRMITTTGVKLPQPAYTSRKTNEMNSHETDINAVQKKYDLETRNLQEQRKPEHLKKHRDLSTQELQKTRDTNEFKAHHDLSTRDLQTIDPQTQKMHQSNKFPTKQFQPPEQVSKSFVETAQKFQQSLANINKTYEQQIAQKSLMSMSQMGAPTGDSEASSGLTSDLLIYVNLSAKCKRLLSRKGRLYDFIKEAKLAIAMTFEEEIKKLNEKFSHYHHMIYMELERLEGEKLPKDADEKFKETKEILLLSLGGFEEGLDKLTIAMEEKDNGCLEGIRQELEISYTDLDTYFGMLQELEKIVN